MDNITINLERPILKEDSKGVEYAVIGDYIYSRLTEADYEPAIKLIA